MIRSRRGVMKLGGGVIAALAAPRAGQGNSITHIEMRGSARGERVWFDPIGLWVAPGTILRFTNRDPSNSHTATSYHPTIYDRTRRIPAAAHPWDSDFLLPEAYFEVSLTISGVYDYYCLPHEAAAMVGRIVVGTPADTGWDDSALGRDDVSDQVLSALPPVDRIIAEGSVRQEDGS